MPVRKPAKAKSRTSDEDASGIVDVVDIDKLSEVTRKEILEKYSLSSNTLQIPIDQVRIVTQDDSKLQVGFRMSTLRATSGTTPLFAQSMQDHGWDATSAGMVQMIETPELIEAFSKLGKTPAFNEWCIKEIMENGALVSVVDGVHRTDWIQTKKPTGVTTGVFGALCVTCPNPYVQIIAGSANKISGSVNVMTFFDILTMAKLNSAINKYTGKNLAHLIASSTPSPCTAGRAGQLTTTQALFDKKGWQILHADHIKQTGGDVVFME